MAWFSEKQGRCMKSNFITTVYGPVIPGIIKVLAQATRSFGGEWLTSKIIKLDGQFAAIMNVVVEEQQEKALKLNLEERFPSLRFVYAPANASPRGATKTIKFVVDCIDRPGLTGDLSGILANLDIGVEDMECKRFVMDGIGDTVFSARLTLSVPLDADSKIIAEEIETLSEDVRVNIQ
jgi:glycine cleavage system regulatory protein